jgi:excinuclease ABC subunit B
MAETGRRRAKQLEFNALHDITPRTIVKPVADIMEGAHTGGPSARRAAARRVRDEEATQGKFRSTADIAREIKRLETDMYRRARNLEFEQAASLRDQIEQLRTLDLAAGAATSYDMPAKAGVALSGAPTAVAARVRKGA